MTAVFSTTLQVDGTLSDMNQIHKKFKSKSTKKMTSSNTTVIQAVVYKAHVSVPLYKPY